MILQSIAPSSRKHELPRLPAARAVQQVEEARGVNEILECIPMA